MRGVMLVREVTEDKEGVTDSGVHHLRYAYYPHAGNPTNAQAWKYAYEFNQPLIPVWNMEQTINVQIPFDDEINRIEVKNFENGPALPDSFSLLSARDAIIADLYREAQQIRAIVLDYDSSNGGVIQVGEEQASLPQGVFTWLPLSLSSLEIPSP